jgi:hypothetical protein
MISSRQVHKYFLLLILLYILILSGGYLFVTFVNTRLSLSDIVILLTVFFIIAFITLIIFFKGETKEADSQTLHILVAVSLKFLLEIIFALVWFIVIKKTMLPSVLMFFVLYLTLTLFSLGVMLITLRNKALQNLN